jgi:signal transduction histidine kinase
MTAPRITERGVMPLTTALSVLPAAVPSLPVAHPGIGIGILWITGFALAGWAYVLRLSGRVRRLTAHARASDARVETLVEAASHQARMVAAVSHDLRQPLAAAGAHASLLARRLHAGQVALAGEQAAHMTAAIASLGETLEHLLEAARADAGIDRIEPGREPLLPILERLRDEFRPDAMRARLRLELRCDAPGLAVVTDRQALHRVLANLLSNAIRCTGARGRSGDGVSIRAHRMGTCCRIDVTDSGPGIPAQRLASIWDPRAGASAEAASAPRSGNLGLGLYLVRRLVGLLPGHRVSVRSRPGRGTRFRIELPLAATPAPECGLALKAISQPPWPDSITPVRTGPARC